MEFVSMLQLLRRAAPGRMLKKPPSPSADGSFRGVPQARDDEESRKSRARFLASLGMTIHTSLDATLSADTRRAGQFEFLRLALLQLLAALSPLLLYALFVLLEGVRSLAALLTISQMVFPMLALIAGLMGGYQFPLASRIYLARSDNSNRNPGMLYALDLLGACLGAVALSAYLLPVYGFLRTAMLMAVVNLAPAALAALAAFEVRLRRT